MKLVIFVVTLFLGWSAQAEVLSCYVFIGGQKRVEVLGVQKPILADEVCFTTGFEDPSLGFLDFKRNGQGTAHFPMRYQMIGPERVRFFFYSPTHKLNMINAWGDGRNLVRMRMNNVGSWLFLKRSELRYF